MIISILILSSDQPAIVTSSFVNILTFFKSISIKAIFFWNYTSIFCVIGLICRFLTHSIRMPTMKKKSLIKTKYNLYKTCIYPELKIDTQKRKYRITFFTSEAFNFCIIMSCNTKKCRLWVLALQKVLCHAKFVEICFVEK